MGNGPIAERLGLEESWIVARTGVHERRHAQPGETLEALATGAGRAALENAGIQPSQVDLVLVATFTASRLMPNAAPLVAGALGAAGAGASDVGAACTGWVSGLALACGQIESGRAQTVLLIGADLCTRHTDPDDKRTAALFGDGAGAVVLTAGGPGRVRRVALGADGSGADCILLDQAPGMIEMRGQDTFRAAVQRLSESTLGLLAAEELALEDRPVRLPPGEHPDHHRGRRAPRARRRPRRRLHRALWQHLGGEHSDRLAEAQRTGRLHAGSRVLVSAFGSGFTWGSGLVEWGI